MKASMKLLLLGIVTVLGLSLPARSQGARPALKKYFGWIENKAAVAKHVKTLRFHSFEETPAYQRGDLPESVFMWKAYEKIQGKLPPEKAQGSIGSCVSFGTNNAIAMTLAVQIAFKGAPYEFKDFSEEVTYGGARIQICNQRGGGDGTNGSCAAKFVQKWGIVAREKVGSYDLSSYSVKTCRTFGDKGVPADLLPVASKNPVKDITLVTSWDQAKSALAQGYGIAICSGQGFVGKRDANGFKKPSGSWSHCMALWGYTMIGGKECGYIQNSWGAEEGPVGPGSPNKAGFWADAQVIGRMLAQKDSWAFSAVVGFPSRKLDWFVLNSPVQERELWYAQLQSPFLRRSY